MINLVLFFFSTIHEIFGGTKAIKVAEHDGGVCFALRSVLGAVREPEVRPQLHAKPTDGATYSKHFSHT